MFSLAMLATVQSCHHEMSGNINVHVCAIKIGRSGLCVSTNFSRKGLSSADEILKIHSPQLDTDEMLVY